MPEKRDEIILISMVLIIIILFFMYILNPHFVDIAGIHATAPFLKLFA